MEKIGENIKKLRELRGMTREQMAAELNMSPSGYNKIERNESELTLTRVQEIAQILQVEVSEILNFDATQVFNVSNNKFIQSVNTKGENIYFHGDDHKDKYIKFLEEEIKRLKEEIESLEKK